MNAKAGSRIVWRGQTYDVIVVRPSAVTLRDQDGGEFDVSHDELNRAAEPPATDLLLGAAETLVEGAQSTSELLVWREALARIAAASETHGQQREAVEKEVTRLAHELGRTVTARTVFRKLKSYNEGGIAAVADQRSREGRARRSSSIDPRVIEALNIVLARRARESTTSKAVILAQVEALVRRDHGDDVAMPSRATFYRVLAAEDRGRFSFGSAKTRESLSLRPDRAFGGRPGLRPGEHVQIDTTRLDVMVRIDAATVGRPELTIMVDVATRSILSAVLRPVSTKSMDLVIVLARALVPYGRRPEGARETRRLLSTAWAEEALIDQERYERLRLAQPFIFPETITTDNGRPFLSQHFRAVCAALGISLTKAAPHTPTDKAHVERTFASIASLFLQYVKGYVGRSVEHRGKNVEAQSAELLTIAQMQELLEDWVAVEWQNRNHDGLRDPLEPTISLTPNEMCRAFREVVPELHVPLAKDDFIALLPIVHRRINRYGVTIEHRIYDSERLAHYRRRESQSKRQKGKWPIRVDPYNLHVVWLEDNGEFIPLRWSNGLHELPMMGDVWRSARDAHRSVDRDGQQDHDLVHAMRDFAGRGNNKPMVTRSAREKAVAADPMNLLSAEAAAATTPQSDGAKTDVPVPQEEEWPNRGGFSFISEPTTDEGE